MHSSRRAAAAAAAALCAALLACVALMSLQGDSRVDLLSRQPSQLSASGSGGGLHLSPVDDAIATGSELTVVGDGPPLNDTPHTTLTGIKTKLARATQLFQEDRISEAELAGRLSREIDRHEKCRRHWPHLGKLEAAQEIRVHDARNNLEVANRAMERARKELKDAEGLVMAARQEHETYETERQDFHEFKTKYDSQDHAYKQRERNVALYQNREAEEQEDLKEQKERLSQLQANAHALELKAWGVRKEHQQAEYELQERGTVQLSPKINFVKGQQLAQVSGKAAQPILTHVSHGIAIPNDASSHSTAKKASSTQNAYERLKQKASMLASQEVKAFGDLPADERKVHELRSKVKNARRAEGLDSSKLLVAKEQLRHVEDHGLDAKALKLAEDKVKLAQVNAEINDKEEKKARKQIKLFESKEQEGPELSRQLSAVQQQLKQMRADGVAVASLHSASTRLRSTQKGRETMLTMSDTKMDDTIPVRTKSRAQLEKELSTSQHQLSSIRKKLLAVRTRLSAQKQEVGVHEQKLRARTHEAQHATTLLKSEGGMPTQQLYSAYDEKLKDLVEERKKADGLLAKAERMLNIARIDSVHAAKTKKYALEELKYSTDKLRHYQDLRSKSQECQMDAWSEIRKLTHNARQKKLLAAADQRKVEALKVLLGDARTQDLAQV